MTGHGRGESSAYGYRAEVEISGINRKQLDVKLSLPWRLDSLEWEIRERLQRKLSRGQVSVRVSVLTMSGEKVMQVKVNESAARQSLAQLRKIARANDLPDDIGLGILVRVPGVLQVEPGVEDLERVRPMILRATDRALSGLVAMRQTEGRHLQRDLKGRIVAMRRSAVRVRRQAPQVARHYRERLRHRISETVDEPLDEDRLVREVALFVERSDITEELTRLESHFRQFERLARSRKPVGRTLDFLAQEMQREINTLGVKAHDITISREVLELKTELEKVREQIQNVE